MTASREPRVQLGRAGTPAKGRSYVNPVYGGYLGDPFVWRHQGVWYAVGSGAPEAKLAVDELRFRAARAGRQTRLFPMLRSEDFVTWHAAGAALVPPDPALGDYFSAPEVAVADGRFYLCYSVGRMNQVHQVRVAVSDRPLGPYEDTGQQLIDPFACYFSNDPHAFRDDDGRWYLFYTRDFHRRPAVRARHEWDVIAAAMSRLMAAKLGPASTLDQEVIA